jgi:uncharacterized Zn-finger protein
MSTPTPKSVVELSAADLQGPGVIACPNPKMALWSNHPRVFIDLSHGGQGVCPYCGTVYRLKAGEHLHAHH